MKIINFFKVELFTGLVKYSFVSISIYILKKPIKFKIMLQHTQFPHPFTGKEILHGHVIFKLVLKKQKNLNINLLNSTP